MYFIFFQKSESVLFKNKKRALLELSFCLDEIGI
jgi:hypothetical protein